MARAFGVQGTGSSGTDVQRPGPQAFALRPRHPTFGTGRCTIERPRRDFGLVVDRALEAFTEQLIPGRWDDARRPTEQELKATTVLRLPLEECSAKVNDGPPDDGESEDAALDIWAGNIPFKIVPQPPVPDPTLKPGLTVPDYATNYTRPGWDR